MAWTGTPSFVLRTVPKIIGQCLARARVSAHPCLTLDKVLYHTSSCLLVAVLWGGVCPYPQTPLFTSPSLSGGARYTAGRQMEELGWPGRHPGDGDRGALPQSMSQRRSQAQVFVPLYSHMLCIELEYGHGLAPRPRH